MASGIRSIVWRSDIDAGRERPAFFCGLVAKRSGQSPAGRVARGPAKRDPANPANPSFSGKEGREEKGKEKREGEGEGDGEG